MFHRISDIFAEGPATGIVTSPSIATDMNTNFSRRPCLAVFSLFADQLLFLSADGGRQGLSAITPAFCLLLIPFDQQRGAAPCDLRPAGLPEAVVGGQGKRLSKVIA